MTLFVSVVVLMILSPLASPMASIACETDLNHVYEEITSVFENSTPQIQYSYCEDIHDGRGYTAGKAGFTTADSDAIELIVAYNAIVPNNPLSAYTSVRAVDASYCAKWVLACTDPRFIAAQDARTNTTYMVPAMHLANSIGAVLPLSRSLLYDSSIQHGFAGLLQIAATAGRIGENEKAWALRFAQARAEYLDKTGEIEFVYRVCAYLELMAAGRWQLQGELTFWTNGEWGYPLAGMCSTVPPQPIQATSKYCPTSGGLPNIPPTMSMPIIRLTLPMRTTMRASAPHGTKPSENVPTPSVKPSDVFLTFMPKPSPQASKFSSMRPPTSAYTLYPATKPSLSWPSSYSIFPINRAPSPVPTSRPERTTASPNPTPTSLSIHIEPTRYPRTERSMAPTPANNPMPTRQTINRPPSPVPTTRAFEHPKQTTASPYPTPAPESNHSEPTRTPRTEHSMAPTATNNPMPTRDTTDSSIDPNSSNHGPSPSRSSEHNSTKTTPTPESNGSQSRTRQPTASRSSDDEERPVTTRASYDQARTTMLRNASTADAFRDPTLHGRHTRMPFNYTGLATNDAIASAASLLPLLIALTAFVFFY